jgi:prophage maintenance system killer protein
VGGERTAFLVGYIFLARNGYTITAITAERPELIAAMLPLADHTLTKAAYANGFGTT